MRKLRLLSYSVAMAVPRMSRRDVLKYAAAAPALVGLGAHLAGAVSAALAPATASAAPLGVLLDYAAGVIPATAIRAAGARAPSAMSRTGGPAGTGCWASRSSYPRPATCTRAG